MRALVAADAESRAAYSITIGRLIKIVTIVVSLDRGIASERTTGEITGEVTM